MTVPETDNQFLLVLRELDEGLAVTDLHIAVRDLVAAVRSTGKGGRLKLSIAVKPAKNKTNMLIFEPSIVTEFPKTEPASTIMYADDDTNNLSRNDPRQPRLPGVGPAEVKGFQPRAAEGAE